MPLRAEIIQLSPSCHPPLLSFFFFSSAGRFTDLPSNMTVKEGQNIEMACAFQSGTTSVYLEIQWWFLKAPEPTDSEEDVNAGEVQGTFYSPPPLPYSYQEQLCFKHTHSQREKKGQSNKYPRSYAQARVLVVFVVFSVAALETGDSWQIISLPVFLQRATCCDL